jgi:hypothetical protein
MTDNTYRTKFIPFCILIFSGAGMDADLRLNISDERVRTASCDKDYSTGRMYDYQALRKPFWQRTGARGVSGVP